MMPSWLRFEIPADHAANVPLVALESTAISHGLPYPENLRTALHLEEVVRSQRAIAATIGIIAGEVIVGLNHAQIEHLATAKHACEVSRRDLPAVVARRLAGANTGRRRLCWGKGDP